MDREIRTTAQHSTMTVDELEDVDDRANDLALRRLDEWLDAAIWSDDETEIVANAEAAYVLALPTEEWDRIGRYLDLDEDELDALRELHLRRATSLAEEIEEVDEELVPTVVELPKWWSLATTAITWEIAKLVDSGLSPSQALDYWIIERRGWAPSDWADHRGVGDEAVRKSRRLAIDTLETADA